MSVNKQKTTSGFLPGKSFPNNDQSFPMVHYILRVQHLQKSSERGALLKPLLHFHWTHITLRLVLITLWLGRSPALAIKDRSISNILKIYVPEDFRFPIWTRSGHTIETCQITMCLGGERLINIAICMTHSCVRKKCSHVFLFPARGVQRVAAQVHQLQFHVHNSYAD